MTPVKEYCPKAKTVVVRRGRNYGHTLAMILELFEVARKDFPKLNPDNVEVIQYGGLHYKGTWGIEFKSEKEKVPDTYVIIDQTELTK